MVGYLFGVRYEDVPRLADVAGFGPADTVRVLRFGDLGLIRRKWPVLGRLEDWREEDWPLPAFCRREMTGAAFRVVYSPEDLVEPLREEPISDEECARLPEGDLSGAGAVEIVLTELLVA